jgi:hypothetical protein
MGLGLLPWDKWLPPYIFGPLLFLGAILLLTFASDLHWWDYVVLPGASALGAWTTWMWFKYRRDIFKSDEPDVSTERRNEKA